MTLKLPTRLATSLGVFLAAIVAVTNELHMSHPVHQVIIAAGVLIGSWLLHPEEGRGVPPAEPLVLPAAQAQENLSKVAASPDGVDSESVPFSRAEVDAQAAARAVSR